jgi:hypothetical protein
MYDNPFAKLGLRAASQALKAELANHMNSARRTVLEGPVHERIESLMFAIRTMLPPRTKADETGYARFAVWLDARARDGSIDPDEAFPQIINLLLDACGPYSRNPRAVFGSMLRKNFCYPR